VHVLSFILYLMGTEMPQRPHPLIIFHFALLNFDEYLDQEISPR